MDGTILAGAALLPHSLELERAVLNAPLEWGRVIPDLEPRDYFRDANAITAAAIVDAQRQGLSPEYPVVRQILRERGQLDTVGDPYLLELARDGVRPTDTSITSLLLQLKELAQKRQAARLLLRYVEHPSAIDVDQLKRDVDALDAPQRATSQLRVLDDLAILDQPDPLPLIPGYWWQNSTAVTVAPPGLGKTALFISKGVAIAGGCKWLGIQPGIQGPVVIVVGEGSAFMKYRVLAAKMHAGLDIDAPIGFHVVPDAVDFRDQAQVAQLIQRLRSVGPVLLGIDTLSRAMPGGDDSKMLDVGMVFANCDRVRRELGCSVEVIHHTGWNEDRERGSSSLRGTADTTVMLSKDGEGVVTLHVEKQKDGPEPPDLKFRLSVVDLGGDHSACVVDPVDTKHVDDHSELSVGYQQALDVLVQTFPSGATQAQWLDAMPEDFGRGEARRRRLYRARRELLGRRLIEESKGKLRAVTTGGL